MQRWYNVYILNGLLFTRKNDFYTKNTNKIYVYKTHALTLIHNYKLFNTTIRIVSCYYILKQVI